MLIDQLVHQNLNFLGIHPLKNPTHPLLGVVPVEAQSVAMGGQAVRLEAGIRGGVTIRLRVMKTTRVLLLSLLTVFLLPGAAHASCAVQLPLSESLAVSSVVFTGTVVSVAGGDRVATVLVDEVWKGGALPEQVEVRGGPGDPQSITSVDRSFVKGDKYLFVPINEAPPFEDNACTATQEYSPGLENARSLDGSGDGGEVKQVDPPSDEAVVSAPNEGPSQAMKGLIFAVTLGLALAVGYVLKRKAQRAA